MAKEEKADSDKRGWFARWRERRKRNKIRASEIGRSSDFSEVVEGMRLQFAHAYTVPRTLPHRSKLIERSFRHSESG